MPRVWEASSGTEEERKFPRVARTKTFIQEVVRLRQVQPVPMEGGSRQDQGQGGGQLEDAGIEERRENYI